MGGPLQQILGIGADQDARKQFERHQQISALGSLLDRPDVTIDAKEHIATQLEDLLNVGGKQKGTLPLLTRIFHHQDQEKRAIQFPQHPFGDPNSIVTTKEAGPNSTPQTNPQTGAVDWAASIGTPPEVSRRGSMTSGQLDELQKLGLFNQEQTTRAKFDAENDKRTQDRQVALQQMRGQQSLAKLAQTFHDNNQMLTNREQLRAHRAVNEVLAANPTWTPDQAAASVAEKFQQESAQRSARIDLTKAMTNALPERLKMEAERVAQGWANVDTNQLRTQIYSDLASNSANLQSFDRESKWAFDELKDVNDDLQDIEKNPDWTNPSSKDFSAAYAQKANELKANKQNLLKEIYRLKGQYVKQPDQAVPSRTPPARGSAPRATKGTARLTEAEIRAAGGSDAAVNRARERGLLAQ